LNSAQSAKDVATTIHEQFNVLESMGTGAMGLVKAELRRRGLDSAGVHEAVAAGWDGSRRKEYSELIESVVRVNRRSDLTNTGSMQLYASVFDGAVHIDEIEEIYLLQKASLAKNGSSLSQHFVDEQQAKSKPSLVEKAGQLGIQITPRKDVAKSRKKPLFADQILLSVPVSFEQINDDLFARRENKFEVFNRVAMESWGTQPTTKVSSIKLYFAALFSIARWTIS
jgi:hypothetical protein